MNSMASSGVSSSETRKNEEASETIDLSSISSRILASGNFTATGNIYTPLIAPGRLNIARGLPSTSLSQEDTAVLVSSVFNKPIPEVPSRNSRAQKSSVRPFFCCGSELSLVSLVDGLELKAAPIEDKKARNGEGCSSSDEDVDDCAPCSSFSRKDPSNHSAFGSRDNHQKVLRRKMKDKHNAKKKWSLHLKGRWNPRFRPAQTQLSSSHRHDLSLHNPLRSQQRSGSPGVRPRSPRFRAMSNANQFIDLSLVPDFDRLYPISDAQSVRILERAEEIRTGIDVHSSPQTRTLHPLQMMPQSRIGALPYRGQLESVSSDTSLPSPDTPTEDYSLVLNSAVWQWQGVRSNTSINRSVTSLPRVHTQVDFIHCLVPGLVQILSCPFYWGVMDRYEAERLLDNKPEGTFLLRDSAQEDFLFSVSFRRYNRSLHARVEQWNHRFSFDAHDPAVFSAPSVCELMEHYKDPFCCMFFEPMLTRPLPRNFTFSLQHLCRAVICDSIVYDDIRCLPIPNSLKQFLQVYHYKQKVRVRHFDGSGSLYNGSNQSG